MARPSKNIGDSPQHLGMQLSAAVGRVELLSRRLNPEFFPGSLATEIQAKLQEYCRLVSPVGTVPVDPAPVEAGVYQANPVSVTAARVTGVGGHDSKGGRSIKLNDGRTIIATKEMLARIDPKVGDYYVTQEDGYAYLNPAAVFQRKYSPAQTETT